MTDESLPDTVSPSETAAPALENAVPCSGVLTIKIDGVLTHAPFVENQVLLEAGEAAGLSLPFTCRKGKCGSCMVKLTEGTVALHPDSRALSKRDRARGFILACRATGTSPGVTLDYDTLS